MTSISSTSSTNKQIIVKAAGFHQVNGIYHERISTQIPTGFDRTCRAMIWDTKEMWNNLSDQSIPWYESENESYIYWNKGDGRWWIDGPSGAGVYIVKNNDRSLPKGGWISLSNEYEPPPSVEVMEAETCE